MCWMPVKRRMPVEYSSMPVDHRVHAPRRSLAALAGAAMLAFLPASARAVEVQNYGFEAAAQEVTQLYWLAETANVCGWASGDDILAFKLFSVRFLTAHLSERNRLALVSLVTENGYEERVRKAALEGASHNCGSNRWR
ncbi:MAG TPA: hypothetical protein VD791_11045, partial [Burkholderiales bacterium]|nr:hypothetical protein [Burkholderiales bacterium]